MYFFIRTWLQVMSHTQSLCTARFSHSIIVYEARKRHKKWKIILHKTHGLTDAYRFMDCEQFCPYLDLFQTYLSQMCAVFNPQFSSVTLQTSQVYNLSKSWAFEHILALLKQKELCTWVHVCVPGRRWVGVFEGDAKCVQMWSWYEGQKSGSGEHMITWVVDALGSDQSCG